MVEHSMLEASKSTGTGIRTMTRPLIQIDDEVREMTEEEYARLLADGWTPDTETTDE